MKEADEKLKFIVFKACVVSVWSDSSMSRDEQIYLSHMTEVLADNEKERKAIREIRLKDLDEGLVLSEVGQLDVKEKEYVFDTCLSVLASDKRLVLQELKFLGSLRKTCGIGWFLYNRKLSRARRKAGARIYGRRPIIILGILFIYILFITWFSNKHSSSEVDTALEEKSNTKEIVVSTLGQDDLSKSTLKTGDEVFQFVRDSIVSVKVFIENDPVCSGSGSVIGKDDTGIIYVVTNKHVIEIEDSKPKGKVRIEVQQHSGARFDTKLDFYSREHDIALLAVKGMGQYAKPLKLSLKSGLKVGQRVYAVGSPIGLKDTFTAGIISALRESYLQTDATTYFGSSGGPLVDQHGALCAVVTRGHKIKNYNFALYSDIILEILEERRKKHNEEKSNAEN